MTLQSDEFDGLGIARPLAEGVSTTAELTAKVAAKEPPKRGCLGCFLVPTLVILAIRYFPFFWRWLTEFY